MGTRASGQVASRRRLGRGGRGWGQRRHHHQSREFSLKSSMHATTPVPAQHQRNCGGQVTKPRLQVRQLIDALLAPERLLRNRSGSTPSSRPPLPQSQMRIPSMLPSGSASTLPVCVRIHRGHILQQRQTVASRSGIQPTVATHLVMVGVKVLGGPLPETIRRHDGPHVADHKHVATVS